MRRTDRSKAPDDPTWTVRFDRYEAGDEMRRETIFALGNGIIVSRNALPDAGQGEWHYPGTYHAGFYDHVLNDIAGDLDETVSLVNLPNWLPLQFRLDGDDWWRLDQVEILRYAHLLDMWQGVTRRDVLAEDKQGRRIALRETRLVSMAHSRLLLLRLELTPQNWHGMLEIRSTLDAGVVNANVKRFQDYRQQHLVPVTFDELPGGEALLAVRTSDGENRITLVQRTTVNGDGTARTMAANEKSVMQLLAAKANAGRTITLEKRVAIGLSRLPEDTARQTLVPALHASAGFDRLRAAHEQAWQKLWSRVALEAEQAEILRPLRFHAFHILQTLSPHSAALDAGVPARGWHGEAYHGHVFWDELFVLPFLNYRFPEVARAMLLYRHRRLDAARAAAQADGFRGAMYPWRSADRGTEVTPRQQKNLLTGEWMRDHTYLQRHIGSAVAFNVWQYTLVTGDSAFLAQYGAEMMLEIARFWSSIACPDAEGRYRINGVVGPDEYHYAYPGRAGAGLDNNAYTNLMAVWTLCRALDVLQLLPPARAQALRRDLAIDDDELALWERISRRMFVPFHADGIISQFEGFAQLQEFDPSMLPERATDAPADWAVHAIGRTFNEFQAGKQADVPVLFYLLREDEVSALLQRLGYRFDRAALLRTAQYYLPRTLHRSSLSRIVYAGALSQADPAQSWEFYNHALENDLDPLKGESVEEGIHLGSMGGTIDVLQRHYLGVWAEPEGLRIAPAIPPALGRVRLGIRFRGNLLHIESVAGGLRVHSDTGNASPLVLIHGDRKTVLPAGETHAFPASPGNAPSVGG